MLFMPCPSELQIRLMSQVYQSFAKESEYCPNDEETCERVKTLGPFILTALCWSRDEIALFNTDRSIEIENITKDTTKVAARKHIMVPLTDKGLSNRVLRYVVYRNSDESFLGYAGCHYEFSCKEVSRLVSVDIRKIGIETVKQHLIAVNRGEISIQNFIPAFLEQIFALFALTGLEWKYRQMPQSKREILWENFTVKFYHVERTKTLFKNMAADVLYYPHDRTFPLVDMYYLNQFGKLVGIQATMSKTHAKGVSTYKRFYDEIGTNPEITPLMLYYLILPRNVKHYSQSAFPQSQFWDPVGPGNEPPWQNNIAFFALAPPDNFEATMS